MSELPIRQRVTLEVGSSTLLGAVLVGLQVGHWPAWSLAVAMAGYCAWVIAYSEATVQVDRRLANRRVLAAKAESPPGDE